MKQHVQACEDELENEQLSKVQPPADHLQPPGGLQPGFATVSASLHI